jgi:phage baseplate assembly protein W
MRPHREQSGDLKMAIQKRTDILGRDLEVCYQSGDGRHEDVDLFTNEKWVRGDRVNDLTPVMGVDNAVQAVIHRIKTMKGELADLGHPDYGSRHHELIGQPNNEHNRNLVKLYILQALAQEPRIEKVHKADIQYERGTAPDRVELRLQISFIGVQDPKNLVIPFSFGERL